MVTGNYIVKYYLQNGQEFGTISDSAHHLYRPAKEFKTIQAAIAAAVAYLKKRHRPQLNNCSHFVVRSTDSLLTICSAYLRSDSKRVVYTVKNYESTGRFMPYDELN